MSLIEAIILGLVQGLTEFIPISSTAHLTIAGKMMGLISAENPEAWTTFMAVIQLGTLVAVFVYFHQDIRTIPIVFLKENLTKDRKKLVEQSHEAQLGWLIILGSVPIIVIGLVFKDFIRGTFTKDLTVIATSLIMLGIILFIAEKTAKFNREIKDLTWKDAILVGLAQAVALIPGSSRSGTTITAGLFRGMTRETAARFSFLLSIPAITASGLLEFFKSLPHIDGDSGLNLLVATVVSGVSGYYAIAFLMNFLKTRTTLPFVVYRIGLGALILVLVAKGVLE
ncbi:MAG TPA: undecaprenyl-diphosphatase UppP [Patescibacteria group bacterium]|nr:undecaprenyl-diphosphatase UppP [Patescibacteria group bacterium]